MKRSIIFLIVITSIVAPCLVLAQEVTAKKVMQVNGEVVAVDAEGKTLTVKGKMGVIALIVDDNTKFINGKSLSDVKIGDKAKLKYSVMDGRILASSVTLHATDEVFSFANAKAFKGKIRAGNSTLHLPFFEEIEPMDKEPKPPYISIKVGPRILARIKNLGVDIYFFTSTENPIHKFSDIHDSSEILVFPVMPANVTDENFEKFNKQFNEIILELISNLKEDQWIQIRLLPTSELESLFLKNPKLRLFITTNLPGVNKISTSGGGTRIKMQKEGIK